MDPDEKVFLERLNNSSRFYETIPRAVRTTAIRPVDSTNPSQHVHQQSSNPNNATLVRPPRNPVSQSLLDFVSIK